MIHFLHLSLVNLLLLASLEERSICEESDFFLEVKNRDGLKEDDLADEATRDVFVLFWEVATLPIKEAFPCFWV